jgi:hypothetical protein
MHPSTIAPSPAARRILARDPSTTIQFIFVLKNKKNEQTRHFEATDAKMLRVSISTTYDMINVALQCFQEFGG